jgi:hypothetical protein
LIRVDSLNKSSKSNRGGKRSGAGRKPDKSKDFATGAATALKILRDLKHEEQLIKLYETCGDARLKTHIIMRLREWAFGKPAQPVDTAFDPDKPLHVLIEHIGRPKDQATAKAEFAGKVVG